MDILMRCPMGRTGTFTIPNSVTKLKIYAFGNCSSLTSITIPNSVLSIEDYVFSGCRSLTNMIIPNSVTSIGEGAFSTCTNLASITLPDFMTSIKRATFFGCYALSTINIPNSVDSIGMDAFSNCIGLTTITLPYSVTSIDIWAFSYCNNLNTIYSKNNTPPIISNETFLYIPTDAVLIVCDTAVYRAAPYWSNFTNILSDIDTNRIEATICQGETYIFNEQSLTSTGVYTHSLPAVGGCDSLIILNLTVNPIPSIPTNLEVVPMPGYLKISWQGNANSYIVYRDDEILDTASILTFLDNLVVEGDSYCYTVKSLSANCESDFSDVVCRTYSDLADIHSEELEISIYPSPAKDKATLMIEGLIQRADVLIFDINGKKIKTYNLIANQKELEIDVSNLSKGLYHVIISNDKLNLSRKLIVQ
jgi:hypothetical protein